MLIDSNPDFGTLKKINWTLQTQILSINII